MPLNLFRFNRSLSTLRTGVLCRRPSTTRLESTLYALRSSVQREAGFQRNMSTTTTTTTTTRTGTGTEQLYGARSTPLDYARLNFTLPEVKYVGMLACQRDPLLASLETEVIRCEKVVKGSVVTSNGKQTKKGKGEEKKVETVDKDFGGKESDSEVVEEWELELQDTVLFPEGGGQPCDHGTIQLLHQGQTSTEEQGEETIRVENVQRKSLDAVHYVDRFVEVGTRVRVEADMQRRWDVMLQHTGQHVSTSRGITIPSTAYNMRLTPSATNPRHQLLSAVIETQLQLDTLSWSLQPFPEMNYIELPRALTPAEIETIQSTCNTHIRSAVPIHVDFTIRSLENAAGGELGGSLPSNYVDTTGQARPPVLRTVSIGGIDSNPCCGTHLPSTSMLETVYVSAYTTPIRGTNARIYFAVGSQRVGNLLRQDEQVLKGVGGVLGCSVAEFVARVGQMKSGAADAMKREKKLREELAAFVAEKVWDTSSRNEEGRKVVRKGLCWRLEDATNSLEFLSSVAVGLKTRMDEAQEKCLFVLGCGGTPRAGGVRGESASAMNGGGALLIVGDQGLVARAGKEVGVRFGTRIRGGGKGKWQGKLTSELGWEKSDDGLLKKVLEAVEL
ncbi:BZ3500_MvSof-1268-A1-R1_Chr10-1g02557 [Microbotryum saponariae]|uniref:BZ3500_MvSof-1268-A1-R1_Chr10-1g02557 protein n=1 Tax=Microbotryum saponariae TaxID=289078 RepID=A0A2X0NJN8_9BASI|nr:BZ3500_MvSof-1268-A1-R1_Chr10-1g02557 [Microbotryum saponariae]SDA06046.1 BZ3501_MvSof-1269-A2-R1_Chr10-1g02158 [Microbotryum saponariae]